MNSERRKFIRHPMCFPLKYKVINKDSLAGIDEELACTKNISERGLLFSSKKSVQADSVILIKIPFQEKTFNVKAKVIHCNSIKGLPLFDIGVAFLRYNEAFKVKLIEQMYLISEYRDLRSMQLGKEISLEEASREWIKRYSKRFNRLYW